MKKIELKELQTKEALKRLKDLTKTFNLKNKLIDDFKTGKINCALDEKLYDIKDFPKFEKLIKKFELEHNAVVYYSFLTEYWGMKMLAVLYVSSYIDDWEAEQEFVCCYNHYHYISSYSYNLDVPRCSEFGDIIISSKNGVLTRIG